MLVILTPNQAKAWRFILSVAVDNQITAPETVISIALNISAHHSYAVDILKALVNAGLLTKIDEGKYFILNQEIGIRAHYAVSRMHNLAKEKFQNPVTPPPEMRLEGLQFNRARRRR